MLKQTIVWTALPHRGLGPLAAGTKLRLSAFVAPRLWSADLTVKKLQLSDFPDFLDWPKTLAGATFEVAFDGGPTLPATRVSDFDPAARKARSDLWKGLFKNDTLVIPFAFEDLTGAELLTFSSTAIVEAVQTVYTAVAIDHSEDLPKRGTLAGLEALDEIARPRNPPTRYVPVPTDPPGPVFVGTPGPEDPGPVPGPGGGVDKSGCAGCTGCLAAPWALLKRLLKYLGFLAALPFTMSGIGGGLSGSGSGSGSGGSTAEGSMSPKYTEFERLQAFVKPTSETEETLPEEDDLDETYDFHQMVSSLGDYPNLLRYFGLVVDLEVTLDAPLPATPGMVSVVPALPLAMVTTNYTPRTHYELGDGVFLAQSRPGGELRNGLLRVDEAARFRVVQVDVPGSGIKLQSAATTIVSQEKNNSWAGNDEEEQGLPYLQTAGLSIVRPELAVDLKATFFRSWALNRKLAALDKSPVTVPGGPEPAPTDEIWAEDALRGYRIDVRDDKSPHWHSLCRRVGKYRFPDAATKLLENEEDEGFVQMGVTEPLKKTPGKRELRVQESLFTWNGWSLAAPRVGQVILPTTDEETEMGAAPNEPVTQFKLTTEFVPKPKSLPRLRYGYRYKLRARAVDLAGNSAFDPDDDAFDVTQAEVTAEEPFRRFEPVAPPMVMLQSEPVEGESLERLVVRSTFDDAPAPITVETTVRHLVPPKTSQLMAERHRKFDGTPAMDGALDAYKRAAREAGSLMEIVDPLTGARTPIPGTDEVKAPLPPDSAPDTPPPHTYWLQRNDAFELAYLPDPYARGVELKNLPGAASHRVTFEGKWPDPKPFRLRVRGIGKDDAPAAPAWVPFNPADPAKSGVLEVELPQGQTYKVRISSWFLASDLDNMAIWGWTEASGVPALAALRAQAVDGRNWLHLPYRTLALVHAVQQPLLLPVIEAVSADKAKLGDTVAILKGQVRVDAKSTEKIDLDAEWEDPFDDGVTAPADVSRKMPVTQLRVDAANDLVSLDGVQHVLGDTKHHHVRYLPTGSTRFREYFPHSVTDDPKNLIRPAGGEVRTELDAHVPNSTRPDAPKPQYLMPLFEWNRSATAPTFRAVRRGGGLRVYMERPWFSSGEGEMLGVVLRPASALIGSPQAEALKKYTSEWGMDPLWASAKTSPLSVSDFLGGTVSPPVRLAELAVDVQVVAYTPEFDGDRNLWYCDILLDPKNVYFPMVRLALVRYQEHSLKEAHISNVVLTDFVQVVPHRDVRYDVTDLNAVKITVEGPAPAPATGFMVRLEEPSDIGAGDELGWTQFKMVPLRVTNADPNSTVWEAVLSTEAHPSPIRMVVMEVEMHRADGDSNGDFLQVFGDKPVGTSDKRLDYRVTFADSLEI